MVLASNPPTLFCDIDVPESIYVYIYWVFCVCFQHYFLSFHMFWFVHSTRHLLIKTDGYKCCFFCLVITSHRQFGVLPPYQAGVVAWSSPSGIWVNSTCPGQPSAATMQSQPNRSITSKLQKEMRWLNSSTTRGLSLRPPILCHSVGSYR